MGKRAKQEEITRSLEMNPRANMRFYSMLNQDKDTYQIYLNKSAAIIISWSIGLCAQAENDLIPLLKYIPTNKRMFLNGIEKRFLPILERTGFDVEIKDDRHIWILDTQPKEPQKLDSLSLGDAQFIDNNWIYHSKKSINYIRWCIESLPSSVIRNKNGKPTAWAFSYTESPQFINMGGMLVLPEFRLKGYAQHVTKDLSIKVFKRKKKPLVHVRTDNIASINLLKKLHYTRQEQIIFGHISEE
jgi:hypothetical protein